MLIGFQLSQTSIVLRVKIFDSTQTSPTLAGKTGLSSSSTGLIISTIADAEATPTVYTVAALHVQTIATLGTFVAPSASCCRFQKVDDTNHPGVCELQIDNSRYAVSGAKSLLITLSGVTGMAQCDVTIPLTSTNPYDGVHGGMSAIPNATAGAANGLLIAGSNAPTTFAGSVSTPGLTITGGTGATGALTITGGTTSGAGVSITTTVGDGIDIEPTSGHALYLSASGTQKHGISAGGSPASGANAGGNGINLVGGGSSTTAGGTAGTGFNIVGGAGSATANGAGAGISCAAGGTTTVSGNDGAKFTGTGNGNGLTPTHAGTGQDFNATTTPLTLAKTTNITGFNDIAATAVVSSGAITTSGGKVSEVALVDTLTTYTSNTPQSGDAYARLGAPAGASVSADVAAVKSDTGTTLSDTATILADVNTGAGAIYSRIGAPSGASIAADIAAASAKLPAALTGGGNIKADILAVGGNTSTPTALIAFGLAYVQGSIPSGTPTTGGFVGNSGLSATDGDYALAFLVFTSGVNQGIGRAISSYTGSSKTFTFTGSTSSSDAPFPAAPSVGDTFVIIGRAANGT
jgi:hypothetical protein